MNKLLTRLNLLKTTIIELSIEKYNFISIVKSNIDEKELGLFSDMTDVFYSSEAEYKGHIDSYGFKLKKKRKFFDYNMNLAIAKGHFNQQGDTLKINVEINGLSNQMVPFFVLIPIFYLFFIATTLLADDAASIVMIPFLLLHGLFMLGIPYFMMRRSIKRMKYELERDFYFMIRN